MGGGRGPKPQPEGGGVRATGATHPGRGGNELPRLSQLRQRVDRDGVDQHGRAIHDRAAAAMGWLWEEWRDDQLGAAGGTGTKMSGLAPTIR